MRKSIEELIARRGEKREAGLRMLNGLNPSPIPAFDEVLSLIHGHVLKDAYSLGQVELAFAERIQNDIVDGLEAILQGREALILENTRDLMEISVLIRKFYYDEVQSLKSSGPTSTRSSYEKWLELDGGRDSTFGFSNLLKTHPGERLSMFVSNIEYKDEYHLHSTSLHPSASKEDPSSLGKGSWELSDDFLIDYSTEILMHAVNALNYLIVWMDIRIDPSHPLKPSVTKGWPARVPTAIHWIYAHAEKE